jgi:hypothetical protein
MGCGYTPPTAFCRPPLIIMAYSSAGLLPKVDRGLSFTPPAAQTAAVQGVPFLKSDAYDHLL